jgi:hypothetical protein
MRQIFSIIVYLLMLDCLFSANQAINKDANNSAETSSRHSVVNSIHIINEIITPMQSSVSKKENQANLAYPIIKSIAPDCAWWGESIIMSGQNFSTIAKENIVYFNLISTVADSATPGSIAVKIPMGARSCHPNVLNSKLIGDALSRNPAGRKQSMLKIVAKIKDFPVFPYIRSIVEDRINHYIYVGYDDSGQPKIAKVDLYKKNATAKIVDGFPYATVRPYLSRMVTEGNNKGEICYIRENGQHQPEIYCLKEGTSPYRVAIIYDANYKSPLLYPVAFEASSDGMHFFVADYQSRHIIHIQRGNKGAINSDWGNRGASGFDFFKIGRRTGLAAYNDKYSGDLAVYFSTEPSDEHNDDTCYKNSGGSCMWIATFDNAWKHKRVTGQILDIEVNREVDHTNSNETKNYFYLMEGGIGTLALDPDHDIRGFIEAISTPPSPIWNSIMLTTDASSTK